MAGKLRSLGMNRMIIPEPDYELEGYLEISKSYWAPLHNKYLTFFYEQLKQKRIKDKWSILSSFIRYNNSCLSIDYNKQTFINLCECHKLQLLLNACIRINPFTVEEIMLLEYWTSYLNYPSY